MLAHELISESFTALGLDSIRREIDCFAIKLITVSSSPGEKEKLIQCYTIELEPNVHFRTTDGIDRDPDATEINLGLRALTQVCLTSL